MIVSHMNASRRNLIFIMIVSVLLGTGFVYGFIVGKTQIFPYQLIKKLYYVLRLEDYVDADAVTGLTKTSLFPVRMTIYDWPIGIEPYSRGGGGITTVGNRVLGVDKNGEFFIYDQEDYVWILGKSINTNIENLALKGNDPQNPEMDVLRSFRFMDIEAKVIEGWSHIFVFYHYWHLGKDCKTTRVSHFVTADFDELLTDEGSMENEDWQLIYESQPCLEFSYRNASAFQSPNTGGRLALDDQNNLFVGLGDHHLDGVNNPEISAQGDEFDYGKIIKIDKEVSARTHGKDLADFFKSM